jgi:flagellar motor protein MotB
MHFHYIKILFFCKKNSQMKINYILFLTSLLSVSVSCKLILKQNEESNNITQDFKGKGSPTYKLNGKLAEKAIEKDATPPSTYLQCKKPVPVVAKDLKTTNLSAYTLESYNARITSNEGSISYTFYDPISNGYINEINKKSIVGIKILKDSLSCKVMNYKFTQTVQGKRSPMSIVFLLDHSGSMGDDRANIVQEALDSALSYKHPDDEITIIKFDNYVKNLITSKDKNQLRSFLRPTSGLTGFGYATAIQDAIKLGIDEQAKSTLKEKMIVLLTDGCENSSQVATDLVQLVTEAKKSKIIVNSIGFGQYVDAPYLSFISQETGGYFRQLFSRNEFSNVFNHAMYRVNNNFKVNFSPCMFGDSLKLVTQIKLGDSTFTNERYIFNSFSLGESIELNVLFDVDKFNIKKEYEPEIKSFIDFLKKYPNVQVEISGHTDSDADEKHNQKLSQNRADEIKKYMVTKGIDVKRISTVGYGETIPKYPNDSPENKALNRRIEAKIIGN